MTSTISSVTNKDDSGVYSWEKSVTDVNNVDESFANARDLGYTRLNYARVTTIASLGKYNERDIYKIQLQSNGNLSISLRNSSGSDEKVLDLSEYETYLKELKQQLDPERYAAEQEAESEKLAEMDLLETTAPGMSLKVYMVKNGKQILIADSTADKDSEEYENMSAILSGEYKASKGDYYIEVAKTENADDSEDYPYAMQVLQGTNYKHDYIMTQADSSDTTNKTISTTPDSSLSSTSAAGTTVISAAYAAQIQAVSDEGAANMLAAGYNNISSVTGDSSSSASKLFSTILNNS